MNLKFTIIIPIFNEVEAIFPLIKEIKEEFKDEKPEVVIVNDGSNDGFLKKFNVKKGGKNFKVVSHDFKLGKCKAMLTGVKSSKNKIIAVIDGDGQNPPSEIRKLLSPLVKESVKKSSKPILICGNRIKRKDTFSKRISSKIANSFRKAILKDDCNDTACALKAFHKLDYLKLPYFRNMHRFLPALYKMNNGKIINIPVIDRPRILGESKFSFNNRFWVGIIDLIKVKLLIKRSKNGFN